MDNEQPTTSKKRNPLMRMLCCKCSSYADILNADMEGGNTFFYNPNEDIVLREGALFTLTAKINAGGERFIMDFFLSKEPREICLRLAARVSENLLGCNALLEGEWGIEETFPLPSFHLVPGKEFNVQVFFNLNYVMIAFNGMHIGNFENRVRVIVLESVQVKGNLNIIEFKHKNTCEYPLRRYKSKHIARMRSRYAETALEEDIDASESEYSSDVQSNFLPVPYYAVFSDGFFAEGYKMTITGDITKNAQYFKVALQAGECVWPQPDIAVQVEFIYRPNKRDPVVVFTTYAKREWATDIKTNMANGLHKGHSFALVIFRAKKAYKIYLNNKYLYDVPYRKKPILVNTCLVEGDLELLDVTIEES